MDIVVDIPWTPGMTGGPRVCDAFMVGVIDGVRGWGCMGLMTMSLA